jgi:hypothetical protein
MGMSISLLMQQVARRFPTIFSGISGRNVLYCIALPHGFCFKQMQRASDWEIITSFILVSLMEFACCAPKKTRKNKTRKKKQKNKTKKTQQTKQGEGDGL